MSAVSPMMPCVARVRRTNEIGRQLQHGVGVERGRESLGRQLHAVALDARETNLQMVPVRPHRLHLHRLSRRLRRGDDRLGGEVERDAEDVGVLDVEQIVFVELVRLAPQRAADHLFAEQLRAERADAEDVRDVVGVPSFGEHRDRHDAADRRAELVLLADRVHHLAQQLLVGDVLGGARVAGALDDVATEALDLVCRHRAELVVERLARFELLASRSAACSGARADCRRSSKLRNSASRPCSSCDVEPSSCLRSKPEM